MSLQKFPSFILKLSEGDMSGENGHYYDFKSFRLNLAERQLLNHSTPVSLTPKAFDVLAALVTRSGHLVEKDELMQLVWPDSFVEEANMARIVHTLRKVLGEDENGNKYIETVAKKGYRFVAEVVTSKTASSTNGGFSLPPPRSHGPNTQIAEVQDVRITSRKRRSSIIAATSVVSVLLFLGGSYGLYRYFSGPRRPLVFESVHSTRLTSNGKVRSAAVSPDGKFIVYSLRENKGQESLWLEHIGSESSVQIAAPAFVPYNGLRISADGDSVDYNGSDGSLFRIPALGGNFTKISDVKSLSASSFIGFSPDGMQIAFLRRKDTGGTTLVVSSPDGTMEKQIAQFEPPIRLGLNPTWSPDRTAIACWSIEYGRQNIVVVKVTDGTVTKLLGDGWPNVGYFTWMPDSRGLFVVGKGLADSQLSLHQVWQVLYPTGDASRITTDSNNYETVSVTSDGLRLASVRSEPVAQIWTAEDRDLKDFKQLTVGFEKFDGVLSLGWLSDGRIVYDSTQNGKNSFWITDSTGSGHRRQLQDIFAQAASPDGRYLVYQKSSTADMGLWVSDLQEGVERQLTKEADVWASFSPDSKWVVYTGYHEKIALFRVPVEGGEPTMIVAANGLCPTVSPDGSMIAFFQWRVGQRSQLAVAPLIRHGSVNAFDVDIEIAPLSTKANLQWNSDGTAITYVGLKDGVSNLWRQNIDGGSPVEVTSFDTGRIFNFAYSQDGSRLALSRGSFDSDVILLSNHE